MDCKRTCLVEGTNEKTTKQCDAIPKVRQELFSNSEDDTTLQVTKRQRTREELDTSRSMHWKSLQEPIASDDDDH